MLVKILFLTFAFAQAKEISLARFLGDAWQRTPASISQSYKGEENEQLVKAARAKYFPRVSIDAVDTTGFAASNSGLHTNGLAGSPFRSGFAADLIVEQTIFDFGRIESVLESAKAEKALAEARMAEDKWLFLRRLGRMYLECSTARSLLRKNERMMVWARMILKETARFTSTGQRSIVDNSLIKTEVSQLSLEANELEKYARSQREQMRSYTSEELECMPLSKSWREDFSPELQIAEPTLLLAQARIESAKAVEKQASSAQLPKIDAMGSVGDMEDVRLVQKKNYAVGVGLSFPLWNGGEDAHREQAAKARVGYESEVLKLSQIEYQTKLKSLGDRFSRERESLTEVEAALRDTRQAMRLASQRYRSLQGPLIDVREAFRQLSALEQKRVQLMSGLADSDFQLKILRK